MRTSSLFAAAAMAILTASAGAQTIAVFGASRGGASSISEGSLTTQLRAAIQAAYPAGTFRPLTTIDAASLAGVDLVMLCSAAGATSAITPLSAAEQTALGNFVLAGGGAVIFVDNDTFAGGGTDVANESLLNPFGVDVSGTGPGWQRFASAAFPDLTPVTSGPFGTVSQYSVGWSGWFAPSATAIVAASLNDNFQPCLLVLAPGVLGLGSGKVVLFSDSTMISNGFFPDSNRRIVLNAIDYVRPAPVCDADLNRDGNVDQADVDYLINVIAGGANPEGIDPDVNRDGNADQTDVSALIDVVAGGACP